jgi:hypothetical protein
LLGSGGVSSGQHPTRGDDDDYDGDDDGGNEGLFLQLFCRVSARVGQPHADGEIPATDLLPCLFFFFSFLQGLYIIIIPLPGEHWNIKGSKWQRFDSIFSPALFSITLHKQHSIH